MLYPPHRRGGAFAALIALSLALPLSGCLNELDEPDDAPAPMCEIDSDCPRAGQVCDEGICWGAPPEGVVLAAVITPPEGRDDLALSEIAEFSVADDGTIRGLEFRDSVTLSGRVVIGDASQGSVTAQVRIRRVSRIPGAPLYQRSAIARANTVEGEPSFSLQLPRFGTLDAPYEVTLIPDDGTLSEGADTDTSFPAELAPPARVAVRGDIDTIGETWVLGAPDRLKTIEGRVEDAAGRGIAGMRVTAAGRWSQAAPLERASTITTTDDDGQFSLLVPVGMLNQFVLTARPAPGTIAPTLTVRGIDVPDPDPETTSPAAITTMTMPSFPTAARYVIPVRAPDTVGGLLPIAGVELSLRTELESNDENVDAWFQATGVSDAEGNVTFDLIPGGATNRVYVASAQPRASEEHGAVFDRAIEIPPNSEARVLESVDLRFRTPVTGRLVTSAGLPIEGASVSAQASPGFRDRLSDEQRALVDAMALPVTTSDAEGRFVLWLDAELFELTTEYSVEVVPASSSRAPRWTVDGIGATTDRQGLADLGDIELPEASFARGFVTTPEGEPVEGAVVTVYEVDATESTCAGAGDNCIAPARIRAVATARADGRIAISLPRP